jgi:hypothetical protein
MSYDPDTMDTPAAFRLPESTVREEAERAILQDVEAAIGIVRFNKASDLDVIAIAQMIGDERHAIAEARKTKMVAP